MKVVVQKFGGTCVESEENQLVTAERIMEAVSYTHLTLPTTPYV